MHNNIITECYADTILVEFLGFEKPNHQLGINQVLKIINQIKLQKVVGVIDDDKKKTSKDFAEFEFVKEEHKLQLLKHKTTNKHLILLKPAFEKWIFGQAEKVNVLPQDYKFKNVKAFGQQAKSINVFKNQNVKGFLNTLKQKNPDGFSQLKSWIAEHK